MYQAIDNLRALRQELWEQARQQRLANEEMKAAEEKQTEMKMWAETTKALKKKTTTSSTQKTNSPSTERCSLDGSANQRSM